MKFFTGNGVSGGSCVGAAVVWKGQQQTIRRSRVENVDAQWQQFLRAKAAAVAALEELYEDTKNRLGEENAEIFSVQAMMAEDEDFNDAIRRAIMEEHLNAAYAVSVTADEYTAMFNRMEDPYMKERAADVRDVAGRIVQNLNGESAQVRSALPSTPYVLCADDLTPGETAKLDRNLVLGFVTARGSLTSHTAILARSMGLPALVGVGEDAIAAISEGEMVAVDADAGYFYLSPDAETVERLLSRCRAAADRREQLQRFRHRESRTRDGTKIQLCANAASLEDVAMIRACGAEGIGLFRSEFLYMGRESAPDEEEQYAVYCRILREMGDLPVVIRTLDIGADKQVEYLSDGGREENPALGCRAIRYSLTHPSLFLTQARALLRAAEERRLSVMFPLISSTDELRELLKLWQQAKEQLRSQGMRLHGTVELGIMIETPAAALVSSELAEMVDFFSIGTNDLTQYTLAMDRQNGALLPFFQPHHPAVLSLIQMTVENARHAGIWVGICGELGADMEMTKEFLRMGVDELSVSPAAILPLREHICSLSLEERTTNEIEKGYGSNAREKLYHS